MVVRKTLTELRGEAGNLAETALDPEKSKEEVRGWKVSGLGTG
jgi:hypothetical protein